MHTETVSAIDEFGRGGPRSIAGQEGEIGIIAEQRILPALYA
ncbi:MAG: hypothetical protein OXE84_11630 [Rhodobacteraceae bacterium]|nr:hypothetical protein [Paracoccaceae bacterium]MCY4197497.1 hypothetical protein [Paracoccaceae bacterium]